MGAGSFDSKGRSLLSLPISPHAPGNPEHAQAVLAIMFVDVNGNPITDFGGGASTADAIPYTNVGFPALANAQQALDLLLSVGGAPGFRGSTLQENAAALLRAAHAYEDAQLSGSAVAFLALGMMKGGPVAAAVRDWCLSIWNLYHTRVPLVTATWAPTLYDFTSCGDLPHTVQELMVEALAP